MAGVKVVVSFVGGWGHAEPLLSLAGWARKVGHRVTFVGQSGVFQRFGSLGYPTEAVGPDTLATTPGPLMPVDRLGEQRVMRDHFVARYGRARADTLGALYDRDRPDLVICDEVDVGSVIACELRGTPCVTAAVLMAGLLMSTEVVGPAWNALRRDVSLQADPNGQRLAGSLAVAAFPRSLRSPRARVPTSLRFARPPILDQIQRVNSVGERPLVYATLGTVFNMESGDLLARLVHAMNSLADTANIDVVITTGPGIDAACLPSRRPGVRVAQYVPQRDLLGRCRAVVSDAGSGTLAAALSRGIPVVNIPMGADQPDNADRCAELGVGIALGPRARDFSRDRRVDRTVLDDASFREAASWLANEAVTQPLINEIPELRELLLGSAT